MIPGNDKATELRDGVRQQVERIWRTGILLALPELRDATAAHSSGYDHFVSAKNLSDKITGIDSTYPPGVTVHNNVTVETHNIDTAIQTANGLRTSGDHDGAYAAIASYVSFAPEEPRLDAIVQGDYKYHLDKGNGEIASASWQDAVADLRRASEIQPTDAAKDALAKAESGLLAMQNKNAADRGSGKKPGAISSAEGLNRRL